MKSILITGGCGFIGSNFIKYILSKDSCRVVNLDALTYAGNPENLSDLSGNSRYKFVHGNIENATIVNSIIKDEKIDSIIHFAAESHVDRSIVDAAPFINTNVVGTYVLLNAARIHGIERFVHISTDEVYGSLGSEGYFTETTPIAPNSPYSASKASSDLFVRAYIETFKVPAITVHCSNNYGPYQFPEKFIPLVITNLMNDEAVPLYGDGLNVRDWIYVEDFCSGIYSAFTAGKVGETYNFGGESEMTNKAVLELILSHLNKPSSLIRHVTDRLGHDKRYAIDISKARRELGWQPGVSFEVGLKKTIDWYVGNKTWWTRVKSGE